MADAAPAVRILIAEDSPTQAAMLRAILEEEKFRVGHARDGREAAELFAREAFDIVLSDIVMPGMDGFELCRHIKGSDRRRSVPIILLTAMNDPMDIAHGLEAGADDFIAKPYDPVDLIGKIRSMLATGPGTEGGRIDGKSDRAQMIGLLVGAFEASARKGVELEARNAELADARQRLEGAAKRNGAGNGAIVDQAAGGIFTLDRAGAVSCIDPDGAKALGWESNQLIGRSGEETILPAPGAVPPARGMASVAGVLGGGPAFARVEAVFRTRTGGGLPVVHACTPMTNTAAGLLGVVVAFRARIPAAS